MVAEALLVSSKFDIFAQNPVQASVKETVETIYRPIATVDQGDLEFIIPADNDMYIDLNIRMFVRGKLTAAKGKYLEATYLTGLTNNFIHSLFSQCSITLNGKTNTHTTNLYQYCAYLENLLTYGTDSASSHLTNAYW